LGRKEKREKKKERGGPFYLGWEKGKKKRGRMNLPLGEEMRHSLHAGRKGGRNALSTLFTAKREGPSCKGEVVGLL